MIEMISGQSTEILRYTVIVLIGVRDVAPLHLRHPDPLLYPGLAQHIHLQETERAGCLAEENWPETSQEERDEIRSNFGQNFQKKIFREKFKGSKPSNLMHERGIFEFINSQKLYGIL